MTIEDEALKLIVSTPADGFLTFKSNQPNLKPSLDALHRYAVENDQHERLICVEVGDKSRIITSSLIYKPSSWYQPFFFEEDSEFIERLRLEVENYRSPGQQGFLSERDEYIKTKGASIVNVLK